MEILSPQISPTGATEAVVERLEDVIRAVHDVLQFACEGSEVVILCRSLHYHLRETLWLKVCGSTFGDQLEAAILAGARVRLLLANDLQGELVSARVIGLIDRYSADRFDIYATGRMDFFDSFPHFTLVKAGSQWSDYVEWKHELPREPEALELADRVSGNVYIGTAAAKKYGQSLKKHFDLLFKKTKQSATTGGSIAAYSPVC